MPDGIHLPRLSYSQHIPTVFFGLPSLGGLFCVLAGGVFGHPIVGNSHVGS